MSALSWVLDPPQETLRVDFLRGLPKKMLGLCFTSALVSYALGETLIVQPLEVISYKPVGPLLILNIVFIFIAFYALFGFIFSVVQWGRNEPSPWSAVVPIAMAAVIPLHLGLPIALLCWPLGKGGAIIYSIAKLSLWMFVVRRLSAGFQNLYGWPAWRGMLVALSPAILAFFGIFLIAGLSVLVAALAFVSLLS